MQTRQSVLPPTPRAHIQSFGQVCALAIHVAGGWRSSRSRHVKFNVKTVLTKIQATSVGRMLFNRSTHTPNNFVSVNLNPLLTWSHLFKSSRWSTYLYYLHLHLHMHVRKTTHKRERERERSWRTLHQSFVLSLSFSHSTESRTQTLRWGKPRS